MIKRENKNFRSVLAHELLGSISISKGYLSMILDEGIGKVDSRAHQYLRRIYELNFYQERLVREFSDLSQIESNKIKLNNKNCEVRSLIVKVIADISKSLRAKDLKLVKHLGKNRPIYVYYDCDKLYQIILNLCLNAIKYTPQGKVIISLKTTKSSLKIIIEDTGIGISRQDLKHIFDKFYRSLDVIEKGIKGTGLGLYIVKKLTNVMNIRITVKSKINRGTEINLKLKRSEKLK